MTSSPLSIQTLFNIDGLVAVITGGGSGLGRYAAKALDQNGAKAVYIVGRREASLKETASQAVNGRIIPMVGDVTDKQSLTAMADRVRKEQGYLNVLFCNAGVIGPKNSDLLPKTDGKPSIQQFQEAMFKPSLEEFSDPFLVNCASVFFAAVAFLDLLDAGNKQSKLPQRSQVLVTSSIAGFSRVPAAGFSYSASKASTTHLVKMLSTYFIDYNIRCNLIAPGLYPSEMTDSQLGKQSGVDLAHRYFQDAKAIPKSMAPAERTGSEQDFAGAVMFLVSPAGAYVDGLALTTDGGRLAQMPSVY